MKNKDYPAMPLTGDAYQDFAGYKPDINDSSYNPECQGLTKREYFAAHSPEMPHEWEARYVQNSKYPDNIDCRINSRCIALVAWRRLYADMMLEELENSK